MPDSLRFCFKSTLIHLFVFACIGSNQVVYAALVENADGLIQKMYDHELAYSIWKNCLMLYFSVVDKKLNNPNIFHQPAIHPFVINSPHLMCKWCSLIKHAPHKRSVASLKHKTFCTWSTLCASIFNQGILLLSRSVMLAACLFATQCQLQHNIEPSHAGTNSCLLETTPAVLPKPEVPGLPKPHCFSYISPYCLTSQA